MEQPKEVVAKIEEAIAENVVEEDVMSTVETVIHAVDTVATLVGNALDISDGL